MKAAGMKVVVSLLLASSTWASRPSCPTARDNVLLQLDSGTHKVSTKGEVLRQDPKQEATTTFIPNPLLISEWPETIFFDAVLRDFKADHPDMQSFDGHSQDLVEPLLGPDKKPVFKGGLQLSTKDNFDQWFHDVEGVNRRMAFRMDFNRTGNGTYVHEDNSFFPFDGKGWGDHATALDGEEHNFYFTLELHTTFVYQGGEVFTFRGDDDVWVFMNGQLVIDLGGVHDPMTRTFAIDSLNLEQGSAVELSFFFAERRCCGSEFRMETSIVPVMGTCTIWGDPHVDIFDNGLFGKEPVEPVGIYTSGDYWLVNSSEVKIQGRYGTTVFTPYDQSALLKLAVGGPFLQGHTLIIEPMEGKVTFDGQPILENFPDEFAKPYMRLKFQEGEKHIDDVLKGYPVKLVKAYFIRNVVLTVNRWPKHIDAIIQMTQQLGGQDGHCGNFNFNASDDTKDLVLARASGEVSASESLFPDAGNSEVLPPTRRSPRTHRDLTAEDCAEEVRKEALKRCKEVMAAEGEDVENSFQLKTCVFDYCFAGNEFAGEDAIVEHEKENM